MRPARNTPFASLINPRRASVCSGVSDLAEGARRVRRDTVRGDPHDLQGDVAAHR